MTPPHVPWHLRSGAALGIGTGPGALMVGASLGALVPRGWLYLVIPAGSLLAAGLCGAQGWRGLHERKPALGVAVDVFGTGAGPGLLAWLIGAGMVGWAGFYLGLAAGALEEVTSLPPWIMAPGGAVGLWFVYRRGMSAWNAFVFVTAICAAGVAVVVFTSVPPGVPAADAHGGPAGIVFSVGLCVSYTALFSVRAADFSWDLRSTRDVLMQAVALGCSLAFFLSLGAAIYLRAGEWNLSSLMGGAAFGGGPVLLILSSVAPAVAGIHSGALSVMRLAGLTQGAAAGCVCSLAAVLGALRLDLSLLTFLGVLGAVAPPAALVMLLHRPSLTAPKAMMAWAAGAALSIALWAADTGVHVVGGMLLSGLLSLVWSRGEDVSEAERSIRTR